MPSTRRLLALFGALATFAWSGVGHAGGVLVRLDADRVPDGAVYVELSPSEGETERLQLQDDGQQPDVQASDGKWAGAVFLPQTEVSVTLVLDGERFEGGMVQWSAPDIPRDLDLTLRDGALQARAREANPHGGGGGDPADGASAAPTADPGSAPVEGTWLIGGGVVVLVGVGAMVLGRRERQVARRGALSGVTLQAAGGFAGPHSPALDDGLVFIEVPEGIGSGVVAQALVDSLVRHHTVLVIAQPEHAPQGRSGRGLFTGPDATPRKVGDALEVVHDLPRQRGVVLFHGIGGTTDDWSDRDDELPVGSGGIALVPPQAESPGVGFRVRSVQGGIVEVESVVDGGRFWVGAGAQAHRPSAFAVVDL